MKRRAVADQGSFVLTGQDVDLKQGFILVAGHGSFALTGQDANRKVTEIMDTGVFALAGQDATLKLGEAVEGVSITVFIGGAAVYGLILPDQDPNWARVTPAQDPQWSLIA